MNKKKSIIKNTMHAHGLLLPPLFSLALGVLLFGLSTPALAAGDITTDTNNGLSEKTREVIEISQAAVGRKVGNFKLLGADGAEYRISDFLGKPLVINLIYSSCVDSCPPLVTSLGNAVDISRDGLGDESFNVITVGFDTTFDTPEHMAEFGQDQELADDNWLFVGGELDQILGLSDDLGFMFYPTKNGFNHLDQITVIDGKGVVHTQIYGANFSPTLLGEPLKAIMFGTSTPYASIDDLIKRVRLFCTIYDPELGRYRFDYGIFVHLMAGATFLLVVGTFLARQIWRLVAENKAAGNGAAKKSDNIA
ncbi:MAG: SCO family protein [Rhodospirillaceae bacterium]|nr:SCO family protein [Rhodospirillaceae bacterium]